VLLRQASVPAGDERIQLLVDVGDLAASKLNDRAQATKSFVAALDERPDDRRLLSKLMQLYSEDKDWNKLVEVVLRGRGVVVQRQRRAEDGVHRHHQLVR